MLERSTALPAKLVAAMADVTAAEQTRVEYSAGRLRIKAPKGWRQWTPRGGGESIDVQIALPAGSHVRAEVGIAAFRCTGRLGEFRCQTGIGEIQLDQAGPVQLKTGVGDITVDGVLDHAELTTGSGAVQIGRIDGTAVIKNSNGDSRIGTVRGNLTIKAANGDITVGLAGADLNAASSNGDVRIGAVTIGTGVSPATLTDTKRALGGSPSRSAGPRSMTRTAAAPSRICDGLPAMAMPSGLKAGLSWLSAA